MERESEIWVFRELTLRNTDLRLGGRGEIETVKMKLKIFYSYSVTTITTAVSNALYLYPIIYVC